MLFSGGLFAFDFYYVPGANRKQDALRDEIKGRATADLSEARSQVDHGQRSRASTTTSTSTTPAKQCHERGQRLRTGAEDLPPEAPDLRAPARYWSAPLKTWIFENGWSCEFKGAFCSVYSPFQATTFRELTEPPDYFLKEALQDKQMNFLQLERYIEDLQQSGFEAR